MVFGYNELLFLPLWVIHRCKKDTNGNLMVCFHCYLSIVRSVSLAETLRLLFVLFHPVVMISNEALEKFPLQNYYCSRIH